MRVSTRAMSVFCPHCQKRAPLESFRITGSHPGRTLATCGDIHVEPTANLNLAIFGTNVFINGRVRGDVTAGECIEVGPTGRVTGNVKAAEIIVRDGGVLEGRLEMTHPRRLASSPGGEATLIDDPLSDLAERTLIEADEAKVPTLRPRPLHPPTPSV